MHLSDAMPLPSVFSISMRPPQGEQVEDALFAARYVHFLELRENLAWHCKVGITVGEESECRDATLMNGRKLLAAKDKTGVALSG